MPGCVPGRENKHISCANPVNPSIALIWVKSNGIKRTAYNIIGLPNQNENVDLGFVYMK